MLDLRLIFQHLLLDVRVQALENLV